jgi:hypothetical protein
MSAVSLDDPRHAQPACCAHDCGADPLLRAEGLLFRWALRARARGGWESLGAGEAPRAWRVELLRPWRGVLGLRCGPALERCLAEGHEAGLLDRLLRRLSGDCAEAGGEAWAWRAGGEERVEVDRRTLRVGGAELELTRWA